MAMNKFTGKMKGKLAGKVLMGPKKAGAKKATTASGSLASRITAARDQATTKRNSRVAAGRTQKRVTAARNQATTNSALSRKKAISAPKKTVVKAARKATPARKSVSSVRKKRGY